MMTMYRSGAARVTAVRREPSLVPIRPVLMAVNADAPANAAAVVRHRTEEDAIERIVRLLAAASGSSVAAYVVVGEGGRPRCVCALGAEPVEVESLTHLWQTTLSRQGLVTLADVPHADGSGPRAPSTGLRAAFFAGIKVRGPDHSTSGMVCILDPIAHALGATARQHLFDANALIEEELLLRRQADHDPLTGLLNRRAMDDRLAREWRRAARAGTSLSVLAIDLDHFKTFNDSRGHLQGDAALRAIADAMQRTFKRPGDLVGRIGGDEFLVCLPQTTSDDAVRLADTLKDLVQTGLPQFQSELSVSIGVATLADVSNYDGGSVDVLAAADAALYLAKDQGRNQVVRSPRFDRVRPNVGGGPVHPRH
ncbi:MAG: GGDEF domain-containing protein [Panacagrimonas sp.]